MTQFRVVRAWRAVMTGALLACIASHAPVGRASGASMFTPAAGYAFTAAAAPARADAPAPTAAVRPNPQRERDLASLRRVHDEWIAAYTAGNVDALERFYFADTVLMPDGRPTWRGWPQIRAFFAPGFARFDYDAKADLQTLEVSGDLGTAKGVVTVTLTPKAGGEPATRALRYLIVFKRLQADDWRIYLDMDNAAIQ
jgi:ketosteroid isomerase-like protein